MKKIPPRQCVHFSWWFTIPYAARWFFLVVWVRELVARGKTKTVRPRRVDYMKHESASNSRSWVASTSSPRRVLWVWAEWNEMFLFAQRSKSLLIPLMRTWKGWTRHLFVFAATCPAKSPQIYVTHAVCKTFAVIQQVTDFSSLSFSSHFHSCDDGFSGKNCEDKTPNITASTYNKQQECPQYLGSFYC